MNFFDVVQRIAMALERVGIPYMLTGSFGSVYYGLPRSTRDAAKFSRRRRVDMQDVSLFVASAEDIVLAKLEWAKLGESQRQIEDAAGIWRMRGDSLDRSYLDKWIGELGLAEQWSQALGIAMDFGGLGPEKQ